MGLDPLIGQEIAGYRIEARIGVGGMSRVYRATQPSLQRAVALKLLSPELSGNDEFRSRFLSEAMRAAAIEHPNILPVHDAGEADGQLFIAMRLVEGSDLGQVLEREGRLEPKRALTICAEVAAALDAAHARGLIHRDVKPGNVLLTQEEHVYLADFGVAKPAAARRELTRTGVFVGTVDYASPEQIRNEPLSPATDIYSLGCVLYYCLTNELPFDRPSEYGLMQAHLTDPPPKPSSFGLPTAVDAVIATALAKAPDERYRSARRFAEAVGDALEGRTSAVQSTVAAEISATRRPSIAGETRIGVEGRATATNARTEPDSPIARKLHSVESFLGALEHRWPVARRLLRRRPAAFGITALIAVTAIITVTTLTSNSRGTPSSVKLAFSGTPHLITSSGAETTAMPGAVLSAGDRLQLDQSSQATLTFPGGSTLAVGAGGDVQVERSEVAGGETHITVLQTAGESVSTVQALGGSVRYEVRTPTALVQAQGTQFVVLVSGDGTTVVEMREGTTTVIAQGHSVLANVGDTATVRPGELPQLSRSAPLAATTPTSPGKGASAPPSSSTSSAGATARVESSTAPTLAPALESTPSPPVVVSQAPTTVPLAAATPTTIAVPTIAQQPTSPPSSLPTPVSTQTPAATQTAGPTLSTMPTIDTPTCVVSGFALDISCFEDNSSGVYDYDTTYSWTSSAGTPSSRSTAGGYFTTFNVSLASPASATITLTACNGNACTTRQTTVNVVMPTSSPTLAPTPTPALTLVPTPTAPPPPTPSAALTPTAAPTPIPTLTPTSPPTSTPAAAPAFINWGCPIQGQPYAPGDWWLAGKAFQCTPSITGNPTSYTLTLTNSAGGTGPTNVSGSTFPFSFGGTFSSAAATGSIVTLNLEVCNASTCITRQDTHDLYLNPIYQTAVVDQSTSKVTNVTIWDWVTPWSPPSGSIAVKDTTWTAQIGYYWNGTQFVSTPPPATTPTSTPTPTPTPTSAASSGAGLVVIITNSNTSGFQSTSPITDAQIGWNSSGPNSTLQVLSSSSLAAGASACVSGGSSLVAGSWLQLAAVYYNGKGILTSQNQPGLLQIAVGASTQIWTSRSDVPGGVIGATFTFAQHC